MSTRAVTFVYTETKFSEPVEPIVKLYTHGDGYPGAYGLKLAQFINSKKIVNGFPTDINGVANGMDCLAAQIVAHFKQRAGNYYLIPLYRSNNDKDFDYVYHIFHNRIEVIGYSCFEGSWEEFVNFCENN